MRQETVERRVIEGQSFLKTRASHPLKFIPLQPSCDTYKYSFWPRTIIDWNSLPSDYLTLDSTAKFKATVSDYIFFSVMFTPFDLLYFLLVVVLSFLVGSLRICLLQMLQDDICESLSSKTLWLAQTTLISIYFTLFNPVGQLILYTVEPPLTATSLHQRLLFWWTIYRFIHLLRLPQPS